MSKREKSPGSFSQDTFGDMDAFLDFGDNNASNFISSPVITANTSLSPAPSPTPQAEALTPEFSAPSHPYGLHVQQTDVFGVEFGDMFGESSSFMQVDRESTPSGSQDSSLPPYFYPERSIITNGDNMPHGISPLMTIAEMSPHTSTTVKVEASPTRRQQAPVTRAPHPPQQQQRMNYYPGYHQEMAAYNENLRVLQAQEKLARQQAAITQVAPKPQPHPQQQKIHAILNSFKSAPPMNVMNKSHSELLPHIARLKKEEEEMDDDERLLASEEGKRLSSKERRQLRNKVSARAFRSRRKEYISQLEAEVAKKAQEAESAREANKRLEEENSRLRGFTEMLMKHSAFREFLNDMTTPLTNPVHVPQQQQQLQAPQQFNITPAYNRSRDQNPHVSTDEHWPLAYTTWNTTPHVFSVQVPEWPAIPELDSKMSLGEDFAVADGFFSNIRDEKGNIDHSRVHGEYENYEEEELYQPPDCIEDLFIEGQQSKPKDKQNLDELFPGVEVNVLLERLELIAAGEAKPEDLFEIEVPKQVEVDKTKDLVVKPSVCASNQLLREAEGVYRRIGMAVGGQ